MKFAALMNIIDPNIGGIMVMGDRGTGSQQLFARRPPSTHWRWFKMTHL